MLHRLADNIEHNSGISNLNWGGFDLDAFMTYLAESKPIDTDPPTRPPHHSNRFARRMLRTVGVTA